MLNCLKSFQILDFSIKKYQQKITFKALTANIIVHKPEFTKITSPLRETQRACRRIYDIILAQISYLSLAK